MPLDPEIGLPAVGYNYAIAPSIDNYIEIIPDTVVGAGFSRSGFYNSTNTGVQFKSWIAFDDPNGVITIDRDVSLVGGKNTPSFLATSGATQNPSDSVNTTVAFGTEVYDTDSCYNNSTYTFTPNVAGKYRFQKT